MSTLLAVGGPWAVAGGVVLTVLLAVINGWLVPSKTVEREQAALTKRGDDWRDAYMAEVTRGEVRDAQMAEVLQFVRRHPSGRTEQAS